MGVGPLVGGRFCLRLTSGIADAIVKYSRSVLTFAFVFVPLFFGGCAHSETAPVGRLDLSTRGATCEGTFTWNMHFPSPALILSDTDGAKRPIGENPNWALDLQVEVYDVSGKLVATCSLARDKIQFANWYVPKTCLSLNTSGCLGALEDGRSYKIRFTVTHEEKGLGFAEVIMTWVVGGP
jgi:hypothetical protein